MGAFSLIVVINLLNRSGSEMVVNFESNKTTNDEIPSSPGYVVRKETGQYDFIGKEKLRIKTYTSNLQYVHIYATRLNALRPRVQKAMSHRLKENNLNSSSSSIKSSHSSPTKKISPTKGHKNRVPLVSISAIRPDGRQYAVIGTLQKRQHLKPSILKEVSEEHNLEPVEFGDSFVDGSDQLYIEDGTQSLALTRTAVDTQNLCNGMVVGVIGKETSEGEFQVEEIFQPVPLDDLLEEKDSTTEAVPNNRTKDGDDSYILFVSGLNVGGGGGESEGVLLDMLASFICGDCGPMQSVSSKIVRMISVFKCNSTGLGQNLPLSNSPTMAVGVW